MTYERVFFWMAAAKKGDSPTHLPPFLWICFVYDECYMADFFAEVFFYNNEGNYGVRATPSPGGSLGLEIPLP